MKFFFLHSMAHINIEISYSSLARLIFQIKLLIWFTLSMMMDLGSQFQLGMPQHSSVHACFQIHEYLHLR